MARPIPTHTKLGKLLSERGLRAVDVTKGCAIYTRTMSDLLSGRRPPTPAQLAELSEFLRVPPERILEDSYPCLPDATDPRHVDRDAGVGGRLTSNPQILARAGA